MEKKQMSVSLATKGIISVVMPKSVSDLGPVPICEPDITLLEEYGEKHMRGKELKPKMQTERRVRYEKKYLE
jgi:hypothetical protein